MSNAFIIYVFQVLFWHRPLSEFCSADMSTYYKWILFYICALFAISYAGYEFRRQKLASSCTGSCAETQSWSLTLCYFYNGDGSIWRQLNAFFICLLIQGQHNIFLLFSTILVHHAPPNVISVLVLFVIFEGDSDVNDRGHEHTLLLFSLSFRSTWTFKWPKTTNSA